MVFKMKFWEWLYATYVAWVSMGNMGDPLRDIDYSYGVVNMATLMAPKCHAVSLSNAF